MSMRKRVKIGRRRPIDEAEIIVIPMIDVMMFLLFFFMVSSLAMVVQLALPVNLPRAATSSEQHAQTITVTIRPEFGAQTAAILNINTLPPPARGHQDLSISGGSYENAQGDYTAAGPLGKRAGFVVNVNASRSRAWQEPEQPNNQTAHNAGSAMGYFAKLRYTPGRRDTLTLTLSSNPGTTQISNRTGLPTSFASYGQGFGFLGVRNADGARPDVTPATTSALGAQPLSLPSQQTAGMDITQREAGEFATLAWRREISKREIGLLSLTLLHSGQDLNNANPAANPLNLPVDNAIEYNPTTARNVHHVQITGSYALRQPRHHIKAGFVLDDQNGDESYQIVPASRLALDAEAAAAPMLAPIGHILVGDGAPVTDINGNPVYIADSAVAPTLRVHRSGFYRGAYLQDTWRAARRFSINYGLRADWYKQAQTLGQSIVNTIAVSPRLNFSYTPDLHTAVRWSYNRLFNTPPLAQGAVVGQAIQPEVLDQYDLSVERQTARGQTMKLAYYVKQIHNQVDTGLLIPGSEIGLYSALNFQYGGVHGIEFSYDITPLKQTGISAYFNYTYSIARPNGVDNTGAPAPTFNDHDQRHTAGLGLAYTSKSGASAALDVNYGSGLASSSLTPNGPRTARAIADLHLGTGDRLFRGRGGITLDVENLFDDRSVMNFQSGFSGTRFQPARRFLLTAGFRF